MRAGLFTALLLLITIALLGQRFPRAARSENPGPALPARADFQFVRLEYTDLPEYHRRWGFASRSANGTGWWMMDWPDADEHFTRGVERLTRADVGEPQHLRLTDDRLFDFPWIYATQVGWWGLTDKETARLREYLLRGGFLVVDDFWGPDQWRIFRETMERALPGRAILDIDESDSVMHVLYEIPEKDRTWIPGTRHLRIGGDGNVTVEQPQGTEPAWRAIRDDKDRIIVAVNYNTDVGDAWEYADAPEYPERMTTLAYRYGINYVIYSMTH